MTRLLVLFALVFFTSPNKTERSGYPVPEGIENILFYVQRTLNTNTIVYEPNFDRNGNINVKEPIKVYWINYEKDGSKEPLNLIEKKKAYGVEAQMIDAEKGSFKFNLSAYRKKSMFLIKSPGDNRYHVFCHINNNLMMLNKIFIETSGNAVGAPKIKHIDLSGKDPVKNEEAVERIVP